MHQHLGFAERVAAGGIRPAGDGDHRDPRQQHLHDRRHHEAAAPGADVGHRHLSLATPWGELGRWEALLAEAGVAVEGRVAWPRGDASLYPRDPDGSLLELATPGLWPNR